MTEVIVATEPGAHAAPEAPWEPVQLTPGPGGGLTCPGCGEATTDPISGLCDACWSEAMVFEWPPTAPDPLAASEITEGVDHG